MSFVIQALDGTIDTDLFHCGEPQLDLYLQRYASQDVRRGIARVFVAATPNETQRPAGFFSLSAGSLRAESLPPEMARKLPRYPVPIALLGRLAVDQSFQGRGLGSILLSDACRKVIQASQALAVAAIVVDAKDASAAAFYRHFGFIPLPGCPDRLLLPAKVLQQLAPSCELP
ncbi:MULTISPECIES: GNAT family N-acetyltransferase [Thiorhodovibrio]|uniref:GNAT family N-acetyltransferase n=1 Tax=Thiorhodovibrio TaxID=61593 RepID=UPI001912CFEE|nr:MULTISPECIES: GNAT family N-acetyltransferase [Thiorhodovibrio]MBK5970917.1 GNAT family N-acetyltransferase [Thiorhodovibrio winogradskyi]WPL10718.1 putative acetyltransferase [Thiorhodovibrio litoralis]